MTSYVNPATRVGGVKQIVVAERQVATPVDDAPFDDEQYVRVNGEWVPVTAPPIIPDTLAPAAPAGLGASGTMAANGTSVDYALQWDAPTQNSDGSPLTDFAYYVIRWRYGLGGVYQSFTTKDTSFLLTGLVPNKDVEWAVLARDYSGNDSAWAEDLIDGLADTMPPNQPPPPDLSSRLGTIAASWNGLDAGLLLPPTDFAYLEFYVSATSGGPWSTIGRITGAGMVVTGGIPIGETRYVTSVAFDTSGNASLRSAESSIVVTGVTGPDLEANSVTANAIEAGAIGAQQLSAIIAVISKLCSSETGRRWEADRDGIRLYDTDETLLVNFPTDPSTPASLAGDLVATSLTITDQLAIRGLVNEVSRGAQLVLATGTTSPTSPPSISIDWVSRSTSALSTFDKNRWGWTWWNNRWWFAQVILTDSAASLKARLADGAADNSTSAIDTTIYKPYGGTAAAGSTLYVLGVNEAQDTWYVEGYNAAGTRVQRWAVPLSANHRDPVLASDGTYLYIAVVNTTSGNVEWRLYNATGVQQGSFVGTGYAMPSKLTSMVVDNFDLGSPRIFLTRAGSSTAYAFTAAGARASGDDFPLPTPSITAIGWDGAKFMSHDAPGAVVYTHTGVRWTTESSQWWVSSTWYDPDVAGTGIHETAQGPRKSFAMKKRARLNVTVPPLPLRPTPTTADDATQSRIYLGRGSSDPGRTKMELQSAIATRNTTYTSVSLPAGDAVTPPPATSNFPVSAPARITSADETTFVVAGDGSGQWGELVFGADGKVSGALVPGRRYASLGGAIRNSGSGWGLIDDSAHRPFGIASVEQLSDRVRVHFAQGAAKVGTLIVGADETMSAKGIDVGASVGTTYADIMFYSGPKDSISDYVYYDSATSSWKSFNGVFTGLSYNGAGVLTLTHEDMGTTGQQAIHCTPRGSAAALAGSYGATTSQVTFYTGAWGSLAATGAASAAQHKVYVTRFGQRTREPLAPSSLVEQWGNFWLLGLNEPV